MMKRKLAIPILLILSLSILSQTIIPSPAGYDSPAIYIEAVDYTDPDLTKTPGQQITIDVTTNYEGDDIWGYQFTLTYNPIILNGVSVTNGDVITTETVTFVNGTFNNTIGNLELALAFSENIATGDPLNNTNTGTGVLATVVFDVVGTGETPITLGDVDTKLKRGDGSNIIDGYFDPSHLGHGYFRNIASVPNHDVAATGIDFHHPIAISTTFNETLNLTYIDANVANSGDVDEIFNVRISYVVGSYPTLVKEEAIIVSNGATGVVTGSLNTTGWDLGYLTIIVEASAVYNEAQTNDNTYNTTLLIKLPGDVQGDPTDYDPLVANGHVNRYDYGAFAQAYGYVYPDARYNVECDFNREEDKADRYDYGRLAVWYGTNIGNYTGL